MNAAAASVPYGHPRRSSVNEHPNSGELDTEIGGDERATGLLGPPDVVDIVEGDEVEEGLGVGSRGKREEHGAGQHPQSGHGRGADHASRRRQAR